MKIFGIFFGSKVIYHNYLDSAFKFFIKKNLFHPVGTAALKKLKDNLEALAVVGEKDVVTK